MANLTLDNASYAILGLLCSIFVVIGIAVLQRIIPKLKQPKTNSHKKRERSYEGKPDSEIGFDLTTLENHIDLERMEHGYDRHLKRIAERTQVSTFHKLLVSLGVAKITIPKEID